MKKKAVSGIMLTLLFIGMLTLAFNIQPVKSEPATIIVPDDYAKIQWAIGNASDGDTIFVRTGTYYEHVVLSKSVLLIGEDKDSTVIDGSESYHVVRITADYVTITNFTIRNSRHQYADDSAIRIDRHSHNIIKSNVILNSLVSIYLDEAHNNTICDNEIIAPSQWYTIWLKQSHHNIIQKNLITNNSGSGIILWSSNWNTVNGNNVTGIPTLPTANGQGIVLYAGSHSNVVSNNRLVYNKYSGVSLMESEGNVIQDNIMERNYLGIYSWKSSNIIHGNTVSNNDWYGIIFYQSNGSIIYHNNFLDNRVSVSPRHDNMWDNGYPSGGNYWSDYEERYPYAKELDDSGIWDTPYVIDENNQDRYPLVKPWISPTERKVGVKVGDWTLYQVNYAYNTNDPEPPLPKPPSEVFEIEQFKFFVQNVHNTNVTLQITTYYKDGSQEVTERFIDVNTGEGIPVFLIGANLSAGNIIYPDYWSEIRINETIPRTYLEVIRETNHYGRDTSTHHNSYEENSSSHIYWDRATGFITETMLETIFTEKTRNYTTYYSSSLQIIATNLWSSIPSSPVEATQELIETIETWNLPKGTGNSLTAKLKVAIHMLDLEKEDGAIRKLTALITRVEVLREKTLANEQADELVLEAQRIIALING